MGASTGGFTDCLLQHGAARVYAIDVGQGILHWKLRQDPRVVVMEKTNARYLERLPEPVTLVTIDASFISLKVLLPVVRNWFPPHSSSPSAFPSTKGDVSLSPSTFSPDPSSFPQAWGKEEGQGVMDEGQDLLALVKPQFEAGRKQVARGDGVIRDPQIHRQVLLDVLAYALQDGYTAARPVALTAARAKGQRRVPRLAQLCSPAREHRGAC